MIEQVVTTKKQGIYNKVFKKPLQKKKRLFL
jgi:hypothetical protein